MTSSQMRVSTFAAQRASGEHRCRHPALRLQPVDQRPRWPPCALLKRTQPRTTPRNTPSKARRPQDVLQRVPERRTGPDLQPDAVIKTSAGMLGQAQNQCLHRSCKPCEFFAGSRRAHKSETHELARLATRRLYNDPTSQICQHGHIAQRLERLTADQQVPGTNPGMPFFSACACTCCSMWRSRLRSGHAGARRS